MPSGSVGIFLGASVDAGLVLLRQEWDANGMHDRDHVYVAHVQL